jgi:hypothetical protein
MNGVSDYSEPNGGRDELASARQNGRFSRYLLMKPKLDE